METKFNLSEMYEDIEGHIKSLPEADKEFNLSEKIQSIEEDFDFIRTEDVKEFIRRRIERTRLICRLYPHKTGEELAGEINEDLLKDAGDKLTGDEK